MRMLRCSNPKCEHLQITSGSQCPLCECRGEHWSLYGATPEWLKEVMASREPGPQWTGPVPVTAEVSDPKPFAWDFDRLKGHLHGEFTHYVADGLNEDGDEIGHEEIIDWTTIKDILKAALKAQKGVGKT